MGRMGQGRGQGNGPRLGPALAFADGFAACATAAPVERGVTRGDHQAYFAVGPGFTAIVEARPLGVRCVVVGAHGL